MVQPFFSDQCGAAARHLSGGIGMVERTMPPIELAERLALLLALALFLGFAFEETYKRDEPAAMLQEWAVTNSAPIAAVLGPRLDPDRAFPRPDCRRSTSPRRASKARESPPMWPSTFSGWDGADLRALPLCERRRRLKAIHQTLAGKLGGGDLGQIGSFHDRGARSPSASLILYARTRVKMERFFSSGSDPRDRDRRLRSDRGR